MVLEPYAPSKYEATKNVAPQGSRRGRCVQGADEHQGQREEGPAHMGGRRRESRTQTPPTSDQGYGREGEGAPMLDLDANASVCTGGLEAVRHNVCVYASRWELRGKWTAAAGETPQIG